MFVFSAVREDSRVFFSRIVFLPRKFGRIEETPYLCSDQKKPHTMINIDKDMLAILHDLAGGKEKIEKEKKAYLRKVAKELGIKQPENPRCANCWRDVATLCWIEARMRLEGAEQAAPTGRHVLREGVDVVFLGHRINAATITDELAQNLIEKGFPTKYFVAIPDPS